VLTYPLPLLKADFEFSSGKLRLLHRKGFDFLLQEVETLGLLISAA